MGHFTCKFQSNLVQVNWICQQREAKVSFHIFHVPDNIDDEEERVWEILNENAVIDWDRLSCFRPGTNHPVTM